VATCVTASNTAQQLLDSYKSKSGGVEAIFPVVTYADGASNLVKLSPRPTMGGANLIIGPDRKYVDPNAWNNADTLIYYATRALGVKTFALTTSAVNGSITRSPNQSTYDSASTVALTAVPSSGFAFSGWSGDTTATSNPLSVSMVKAKNIVAEFRAIPQYGLTITASGGTVTKTPDASTYDSASVVKLSATALAGYTFTGWSGDTTASGSSLSVTMTQAKNITANFTKVTQFALTVQAVNGTVVKSPSAELYDSSATVTLTATPNAGFLFTGWSDDATGINNPLTLTMNQAKSVTAVFTAITYDTLNRSENLVEKAAWDSYTDGSSTSLIDSSGIVSDNGIAVTFTLGSKDTCWGAMDALFDLDLEGANYVKVVYKSSRGMVMSLNDSVLSESGESFGVNLPVASDWSTKVIKIDNTVFKQPSGATSAALSLSQIKSIGFYPGSLDYSVSTGGTTTVAIRELVVYGKGALMKDVAVLARPKSLNSVGISVSGRQLSLSGVPMGTSVALYSITGRQIYTAQTVGNGTVDLSPYPAGAYVLVLDGVGCHMKRQIMVER